MYIVIDIQIRRMHVLLREIGFIMSMESNDIFLSWDWDPCYLAYIFDQDFFDMAELWDGDDTTDSSLLESFENKDIYAPILEDISLDDDLLHEAVEEMESQLVTFK